MTAITINPLQGIDIDGIGPINFGMDRDEVESILGKPARNSDRYRSFYDTYECRIDFDGPDTVEFIEFIYGPFPERTTLSLYGINPFQIGADNLVTLLSEKNAGPIDDSEAKYCFTFHNISVGVWRDMTEEDAEEAIAECKASGDYKYDGPQFEEDLEKSRNFFTVGIGRSGYYTKA